MEAIFKLGDHNFFGISLSRMFRGIKCFWITFLFMHLTINFSKDQLRIGLMVGAKQIYFKVHLGLENILT
tara:strand:- start:7 stop:216 length:210 start_codon:yes stop_codon:yes gene_type:complete